MAYAPIAGIIPQYDEQDGWFLKFYQPNTTNPISMATDSTGGTLLDKAELDVDGFITTDGTTLFIPHLDQVYDAYLFPTAAEADSNDTINAKRVAQTANPFDDAFNLVITKDLITFTSGATSINVVAKPVGLNLIINGVMQIESNGDYSYSQQTGVITLTTGLIAGSQVEVQYGSIVTVSAIDTSAVIKDLVRDYGAKGDAVYTYNANGEVVIESGTDDTQALIDAMTDFAGGAITALTVPDRKFWIDSSAVNVPSNTNIIGSGGTEFIMSTTDDTLNLFIVFYNNLRVSNVRFSGFKIIGSKVDDNARGATGIFTLGADGVYLNNLSSEGSKGLVWLGEDKTDNLYGTRNVFANNIYINDCKLFSFYIRGVEVPAAGFDTANETSNINISNLIVRGSNVGLVSAEGNPKNIKVVNYDSQLNDNLLQIEKSSEVNITNFYMAQATSKWNAASPAPSKFQWQISGSSNISFTNGYIDSELQALGFGISNIGCKNISFTNVKTGDLFRCTTLNVQNGADAFKGLFGNWAWTNCTFPRDGTTFFQSDTVDQAGLPLLYWRDWGFASCLWENNSTSNPIISVACTGSMVFDEDCNFNGKPPRALKGQKITFNATVRANGITGSDILFTAVPGLEATDQEILRLGCNVQIEGEVEDTGFDIVHDNGSYDSRGQAAFCRISNAVEFNDHGASFYRFSGTSGLDKASVGTYKSLFYAKSGSGAPGGALVPDFLGQTYIDTSGLPDIYSGHALSAGSWVKLN